MTCPHRFDVAPYALGTLDPGDRAGVAAHLPGCHDCQAVLESVAGLPGLLARVDADALETPRDVPDQAMFERLLARSTVSAPPAATAAPATSAEVARFPHRRRWALAGVAAAILLGGGAWVVQERVPSSSQVIAASSGPVHATVWVTGTPVGTAVRIELAGVPAEQHCSLVAVDRAGHRSVAATWEATYSGTATFAGSVPVPADQLASLRVETEAGTLLTFPVS